MGIKIVNRYLPGDLYTFQLEDGQWGAGMPWSHDPRKRYGANFCLMAGFRICKPRPLALADLENLSIKDVCLAGVYKERRFVDGTWTRLGMLPTFSPETWPLPVFYDDKLTGNVLETDLNNHAGFGRVLAPPGTLSEEELKLVIHSFVFGFEDGFPLTLYDVMHKPNHWRACRITDECVEFWAKLRQAHGKREAEAAEKRRRLRAQKAASSAKTSKRATKRK